jgi:hypothetical protein
LLLLILLLIVLLPLLGFAPAAPACSDSSDNCPRGCTFAATATDTAYEPTDHRALDRTARAGPRLRFRRTGGRRPAGLLSRRIGRIVTGLLDRPLVAFELVFLLLLRALPFCRIHKSLLRQCRRAREKCGNRRWDQPS